METIPLLGAYTSIDIDIYIYLSLSLYRDYDYEDPSLHSLLARLTVRICRLSPIAVEHRSKP